MAFNLASLVKTAKRYALNPSMSDEKFINAFLEPYVIAGNIRGRGDTDFYLDRHRTSRILAGEADVPRALRAVELQHGLEKRVAGECGVLFDELLDSQLADGMTSDILLLLDGDDRSDARLKELLREKAGRNNEFVAAAVIAVVGRDNKSKAAHVVWDNGSGKLCWQIGDLFRFGFGNRKKRKNLVVVPVDCGFETHVTRVYENAAVKRVSENSIHGQWLDRMANSGVFEDEIASRIQRNLMAFGYASNGSSKSYPVGAIAAIETGNAVYLLLAVSEFDAKGVARSSREGIISAVSSLAKYYDENGQAADLYLPLIGSGLSRSGVEPSELFDILVEGLAEGSALAGGTATIVLQAEMARRLKLN